MEDKELKRLVKKFDKTEEEWEQLISAGLADVVYLKTAKGWATTYRLNREALGGQPQTHELPKKTI